MVQLLTRLLNSLPRTRPPAAADKTGSLQNPIRWAPGHPSGSCPSLACHIQGEPRSRGCQDRRPRGAGGTGGGQGHREVEMREKEEAGGSGHTLRMKSLEAPGFLRKPSAHRTIWVFSLSFSFVSPLNLSLKNNILGNPWVKYVTCPFL